MPDSSLTTDAKLQHLGLLPLREKLMLNKAVLAFKAFQDLAPQYLKDLFICHNSRAPSRSMILPKPRRDLFKTSFSFAGASLWNSIPAHTTSSSTLISFKTQLRKWLRNKMKNSYVISWLWIHTCMHVCISMVLSSASCSTILFVTLIVISHRFICDCVYFFLLIVNLLLRFGFMLIMCMYLQLSSFCLFCFCLPFLSTNVQY